MACVCHAGLRFAADAASMPFAEPGIEATYPPSWTARIDDLAIRLRVDPANQRWEGEVVLTMSPLGSYDGTVTLDAEGLAIESIVDSGGEALRWRQDDRKLVVQTGDALSTMTVTFAGEGGGAGIYFVGPSEAHPDRDAASWTQCQDEDAHYVFPCFDHPRIKHPWRIRLEAPEGFTLLSNGARGAEGVDDGIAWAEFDQAEPMPAYLFTAVAAQLESHTAHHGDLECRYYVPKGQTGAIERSMGRTPDMIAHFEDITGVPYPWPRYDQVVVHDFVFGGMENIACTTMTDVLLVDDRVGEHWPADGLVAHELAHQWFGDLVTCQDWSQAWLNESFATFMEVVWWAHDRGAAEAAWYAFELATDYLGEDGGRYRRPIQSYAFREPIDLFDRHLYQKGGVVLRTLMYELGADVFWRGVEAYLTRHAHGTVHTRDLQTALEETSGRNLERFFDQWIRRAGHPDVAVQLAHADGLLTVSVTQSQSGAETPDVFHFGLALQIVAEDGTTTSITLPVKERDRTFAIPLANAPRTVRVDPDFRVLADLSIQAPSSWLDVLLEDACPVLATRAVRAIQKKPDARTSSRLAGVLVSHPFHGVRAAAASALGSLRGEAAFDALRKALADRDERVVSAAAAALKGWRTADCAVAMAMALPTAPTWHTEGQLLITLGHTRMDGAADTIRGHLGKPGWNDWVTRKGLTALAATESADVLDDLITYTGANHADAARALGTLADAVESCRDRAVERLSEMLSEGGFRAVLGAIDGLRAANSPAALGPLSQVHQTAPDGRTRRMAYEAMFRIKKGRTTAAGLATLRGELEALRADYTALRGRLDKVERMEPT